LNNGCGLDQACRFIWDGYVAVLSRIVKALIGAEFDEAQEFIQFMDASQTGNLELCFD